MNRHLKKTFVLLISLAFAETANGQGIKMGEVVVVSTSSLKKNVKPDEVKVFLNEVFAKIEKNKTSYRYSAFSGGPRKQEGRIIACIQRKIGGRSGRVFIW